MTREQIGTALEYKDPDVAIGKIHDRHQDRLSKFSTLTSMVKVEGTREVTRNIIVYYPKGIYEICRWSRQPKADAFMDWVWDAIEDIRTSKPPTLSPTDQKTVTIFEIMLNSLKHHDKKIHDVQETIHEAQYRLTDLEEGLKLLEDNGTVEEETVKRLTALEHKYSSCYSIPMKPLKAKRFNVLDMVHSDFQNRDRHQCILSGDEESDNQIITLANDCIEEIRTMRIKDIKKMARNYGRLQRRYYNNPEHVGEVPPHINKRLYSLRHHFDEEYILTKLCYSFDRIYSDGLGLSKDVVPV